MPSPHSTSPSPPLHDTYNNSYYSHEEDVEEDPGFSELQTVALACFLTLLPLMFGLVSYFGLRVICKGGRSRKGHIRRPYVLYCWGRFRRSVEPSDLSKALDKESSHRNRSSQGLLNDQLKSSESQFSVVPAEDIEEGGASCYQPGNLTSKATANGSVITMTMRNNHLIVETETAITEEGIDGEVDNNDVLVVEVAPAPDSTAIVHQAPPSAAEEAPPSVTGLAGFNTGLSTSDLSISSLNRGYVYGNQTEYDTIDNYETMATQQLICHIVAPIDTYIEPQVPIVKPNAPEGSSGSDLQLSLKSESSLKGETNPAYLPTPVTTEQAASSTTMTATTTFPASSKPPETTAAQSTSEEGPTS
ncbi:Hypothetical protein NTJ_09496 [Nesidiocoris tenuis]|uniref:Uncharacterized protein n=1 Tax=Nesidiocoris tenuis TaxID=355587 RepID=A0ABN7AWW2_9HEMI|nr:Hypothetical protein NTJ_09496 [Nesidiocoris tenuis]